jgi:hypothetical protein
MTPHIGMWPVATSQPGAAVLQQKAAIRISFWLVYNLFCYCYTSRMKLINEVE